MDKLLKKFIAVMLVITLAGANLSILGMYGITYALTDQELAEQTTETGNSNVEFNAYFEGGGHNKTEKIDSKTAKLYVSVKVKNAGYLKNGTITFENVNFKIGEVENDNIQSIDKANNQIVLKQLNNGSDVTIEIPISILDSENVSIDNFSKETKAKFSGTYIDGNGIEKSVSNEIINKLSWEGTAEGTVTSELTKYIPYATGEKYGVMLQTKVNSGVVDSKLPIKKTEINVQVPEINGTKPTDVNVIAINTKATTGDNDGLKFTNESYVYDAETGMVKITVESQNDKIVWLKSVQDEYLVTFIFEGQEIYNYAKTNGVNTTAKTSANIEVFNCEDTTLNVPAINTAIKTTEKLGTIADFDIDATAQISKGQIYANYDATKKKEVSYFESYTATVNSCDLTDKIQFTQGIDKFLTKDGSEGLTTVSGNNYTYNKTVNVNVDIFKKMLGEDGSIDVYKADQTKIGTIDKASEIKDGNYVLDISTQNTNEIYIIASQPITEGQLVVAIEKAIKTSIDYSKTQMQDFTKMEVSLEGKASTSTVNATKQILLKEPTSVAKIAISKTDLTTVVKNENVEIRATLDTSNVYNALYKNPTLKITLPSYISRVDIKNSDILMANGLKIKGTPQVTTEDGKPVITITLEGTQEEYTIGAEYEGTIIVLNTDLTVKTLTPSNSNKMTMEFTNENAVSTNSNGTVEAAVNFVAPTGVVAANGISNYAEGKADIMSISDQGVTGNIATYSEKRTATIYGKVVNNYENKIGNIVILGRMPVKDNKKIDTTESLDSTFSTTLKTNVTVKGIDDSKYTVYYSENVDATKDLSNTDNGWATTATTATKSYMIVTKNYEMTAGETIEFSYDVEIPANLKHNNSVSEMYKVYYNNISSIGEMAETKVSSIMTMATGQGPELSVELKSTADVVREGQIIKMKVLVKNNGSATAKNVKVNVPLPENAIFMEYVTGNGFYEEEETTKVLNVGTLEAGKSKEASYYIKIDDDITDDIVDEEVGEDVDGTETEDAELYPKEISHKVTITADEMTGSIPSNEYKFSVQEGKIALSINTETSESQVLKKGDILTYTINVRNISGSGDLSNTVVTIPLPTGAKYKSAEIKDSWDSETGTTDGITYDEASNTVTVNVGTLTIQKMIAMDVEIQEFEGSITILAKAKADGTEEHYSNVTEYMSEIIDLEVSELTSTPKYVKEGELLTYTLKLTNKGSSTIYDVRVSDTLPEGLTFEKATYTYAGKEQVATTLNNGRVAISINQLGAGETTTINVIAKAGILPDKNDKEIENKMTVSALNYNGATTNTVKNVIEYYQTIHDQANNDNPSTEPTVERYKITGTAWLDSNKNGKRDTDETLLSNISVLLLNKENNTIVKDVDTNEQKRTSTGDNGTYEFTNLVQGEYIVIFLYDASRYSLTTYQEKGVDSGVNSDVIDINITVDGVRTIAGTTDVIKISNENVRDIDIGLYAAEKFDLKLDKYISKITRTTPSSGTKTYTYNNSQLAKIEVLGQSLGKSSIVIEYKIVVTNEGSVSGYAKKIVDYLPEGVGFSTELNKDWYLSDNGNVYNTSLANELIKPGETKELTLVVTKKITEDSLGNLNNNAEIYESYNEQGLKDMDSTAGNKVQDEDDMSKADIILSIVTGKIIMYTAITLGVIAILGFGIFEIKKRVLDKKNN